MWLFLYSPVTIQSLYMLRSSNVNVPPDQVQNGKGNGFHLKSMATLSISPLPFPSIGDWLTPKYIFKFNCY